MKRRLLSIFLSLTMILSMVPSVWAADEMQQDDTEAQETETPAKPAMNGNCGATEADDVTWKLEQNNTDSDSEKPTYTLTISGSGAMADYYAQYVQRATEFDGDIAPWRRALLSDPSADRTTEKVVPITEVEIGDGVTRIGSGAFAYTELTGTVTFNANVTSYGDGVFARDTSITAVDWTNFKPTEKITDGWATSYTEEHIAIPYAFFDGCSSLATSIIDGTEYSGKLVLPDNVDAIYVAAFRGTAFSTVDFSGGLSRIRAVGSYAITKLANMTEFTYPGNVDFYGVNDEGQNNVIQGGGIEKLTIAKDVTELPASFCTNTENLTAIEFESGSQLTKIGKMAFYGTQALKSIDIPSTVTSIGESAFADCFSLEKIELGQIESFGQNTFARCSSLETAKIQGSSDVAYPSNMFSTWGSGHSAAPLKTLEIGAGKIQFSLSNKQKDSIETIVLGDGVTEIPNNFAANCTKLTSVSLPDALTSVPANAFQGCSSLEKVGISESSKLQSIGNGAFVNSALTQIYIPKGVTSIGSGAFNRTPTTVFDMSDVLAESMEVGDYAINNWYASSENKPAWKDDFKYIYVSNNGVANSVKAKTSNCNYAFFVTNGGSVDATKTGFDAVYRTGYTAEWYDNETCTGSPVTGNPVTGKIYYAKWIKSSNVTLTSDPAAENGKVSAAYNPNGSVTLSVQKPGANWLYTWMKDGEQIPAAGNSLTLYTPAESGTYTVKVMADGNSTDVWTSNAVNVTITKAAGTASVSMDGWAYGETAKAPVPTSATNGTDNVTYLYKVKDADDSTYSAAVPTAAGSYTVKATFPAMENYEETAATTDFTIAQAAPTVSITAEPASLVGGGTVKLTVTTDAPAEVVPTCEGVTVTKTGDGTFSALLPNETKTYTFTASYAGDDNHKEASDTCRVSVTRRSSSGGSSSSSDRSYAVTAPSTKNGDVTVSPKNASKGDRVTITVTPDKGYELDKLTVKDASGNKLKLTDKGNGKYTFTMPGSKVTVSAEFVEEQAASIFADVPTDAYYAKAVEWAVKKGITNGKANGLFGSNDPCTRGQIVTFLWRAAGSPAPKGTAKVPGDVLPGSYCYDAVAWALENGITNGLADGTFGVNNTCTRGQSVTFLFRAIGKLVDSKAEFSDVLTDSYYANAVAWAVENGVTNGIGDGLFGPDNSCTRAQIVTFLFRAYQGK